MSTTTTTTTVSASRRRTRDEARELLSRLRAEHPKANRIELTRLYIAEIRPLIPDSSDPDMVELMVINPLREWVGAQIVERRATKSREERAAEKAALIADISARDSERVEAIVTRRLLEYEMIDGRVIGDLSGADCRKLAENQGSFFRAIAEHIPPRAKVRNHYNEVELQALARQYKLATR